MIMFDRTNQAPPLALELASFFFLMIHPVWWNKNVNLSLRCEILPVLDMVL